MFVCDSRRSGMKNQWLRISLIIIAIVAVSVAAAGCGKSSEPSKTTIKSSASASITAKTNKIGSTSASAAKTTPQITTIPKSTASAANNNAFGRLEDKLDAANIYFQKTWMGAQLIGAQEGYKYATRSGTFELYQYDKNSEDYKTAVINNAMSLNGTLFPAIIKDGFALYFYDNATTELRNNIKGMLFP